MPANSQGNSISYITIDSENNYFDTREQIERRALKPASIIPDRSGTDRSILPHSTFTDTTIASKISGSNQVAGLFSRNPVPKDTAFGALVYYPTGSTVVDQSGNDRSILALNIDFFSSSSIDSYKNGVEITRQKHWTAGLAKITAGEPGHLLDRNRFGIPFTSVVDPDKYVELSVFDPVLYVSVGINSLTFPIITGDSNEAENYASDGIIEPFPIRSVIANMTTYFPYEAHSTKGSFESGNSGKKFDSDSILTVDYYRPKGKNKTPYFDDAELIILTTDSNAARVVVGTSNGYYFLDQNEMDPWIDQLKQRDQISTSNYSSDMIAALQSMITGSLSQTYTNAGGSYVNQNQKSAAAGFVYNGNPEGTDSIAYGGLLY